MSDTRSCRLSTVDRRLARCLLAALTLTATTALAQDAGGVAPLDVKQRAIPGQVKLGEPFVYEITVAHPPAERWEIDKIADSEFFEFSKSDRERTDSRASAVTTFKITFQLFDLGTKTLPDVTFGVAANGTVQSYTVKGIDVEGMGVISDKAADEGEGLYDIKPNADVPVRSWRLLYALLIALAVAAIAYGIFKYLNRPKPPPIAAVIPAKPLEVRTLEKLDALKAEDLPSKGRAREFYFRLSEILRGYLGERFQFEALECTGSELVARARGLNATGISIEALERFVTDSDLAKFAKAEPSVETCSASLQYGYRLVHDTTPHVPRPPVQ